MECIEIKVRKETAEKWRKASSETRDRIERRIELELTNDQKKNSKENFLKYLDDLGQRMEKRGLTADKLKDLLVDE